MCSSDLERLVAAEQAVPAGQQVPLQPALAGVLGQHLHHPAGPGQVLVDVAELAGPDLVGDLVDRVEPVGRGLVGAEDLEVGVVVAHHVDEVLPQHAGRLVDGRAGPLDLDGVRQAVEFLDAGADRAGVFAGQDGLYYDLWALRHTELCPQDIWEELYDYAVANKTTDEEAFRQTFRKRLFPLPRSAPPLEVDSAFGGLGLYKAASVLPNPRQIGRAHV